MCELSTLKQKPCMPLLRCHTPLKCPLQPSHQQGISRIAKISTLSIYMQLSITSVAQSDFISALLKRENSEPKSKLATCRKWKESKDGPDPRPTVSSATALSCLCACQCALDLRLLRWGHGSTLRVFASRVYCSERKSTRSIILSRAS